jgi:tetratricopeptide (TPR) repeat protein/DNA-binding MarR family transcriptional regulator
MPKLVVSQNERILLHLSELDKYRDDPDVPMGVSQEGIAQKIGTQVVNASRALSSLESEGLVFDRLAHVRGAPRRRRAYFLTEKGKAAANAIRADIGRRMITIEHAGKAQELPVDEAVRKLTSALGRIVSMSEVVELAREFDTVISSSLAEPSDIPTSPREFILRVHGRPKVEFFFGREQELRAISEAVSDTETHAVLVWGLPGIGKSTLASRTFDMLVGKSPLFWYAIRDWDTESSFLGFLTEFLAANGRTSTIGSFKHGASGAELFVPLASDLTGSDVVVFLDDVQKSSKSLASLLSVLLEAFKSSGSGTLVLISRSVPPFFSRTETGNVSIELGGMDRDSAWKFAQSLNVKDSMSVVDQSHGNPLLLNLMARGNISQAKGDVISFIEREVYSSLTQEEKAALELLSIFRHPVPLDALGDVKYGTITELRRRALVVEEEDGISTHDLLRDFLVSHLPLESKRAYHKKAAEYCTRMVGVEWILEALHHSVEAEDWDGSARIAAVHADELGREFPDETLAMLMRVDASSLGGRERAELLFLRGQLNESMDRQEAALADFEQSLVLLDSGADSAKRALVLEASAKLQSQVRRWTESIATHRKALQLYEAADDMAGQVREWMNIGGVLRKKGDFDAAREAYDKALSLSSVEEDRSAQAACLNNLGLLDWDESDLMAAEMHMKESTRLAHAVKDHSGEAQGLENLGELLKSQGRLREAAETMLEAAEAFRRVAELVDYKRLVAHASEFLGMQGRQREGIELCERALSKPELRRRRGLFQKSARYDAGDLLLSSALVELHRSEGEYDKAGGELSRYMSMSESVSDPVLSAKGKLLLSLVKEDIGDLDAALAALDNAREILRTIGDSPGLIAVHLRRGVISEKKGDYASAEREYGEAARHADLVGDRAALELANENLASLRK